MTLPLSEDRWRRLETLFVAASGLGAADRDAFLEREAAGDPDLLQQLRGMLAHETGAAARIDGIIAGAVSTVSTARGVGVFGAAVAAEPGRRFGAYRVVREIGRGGMGLVFEAARDDDEYRKRVAIKIPPLWTDQSAVVSRFRLERQILAGLEHPHIARFLDGGTEDGVPYFVMEYVEGLPITAYCEQHRLDLHARLSLFFHVCAAVEFAHQSLVVHRDLKPANILVSSDGTLKLLDFGIATLLDPIAGDGNATAERRWTPDYSSPEQVRGRPVTLRTDVYALGLILYELVTGQRAQIADTSSPLMLERSICEAQPLRPSDRVPGDDAGRVRAKRLRGDLDTIVMTAIAKEPEHRYGTAAALADDLARWRDGHPIVARPSTAAYRARKFLRRHWTSATAAALVVVSLAAGLSAAIVQWRRAERRFQQVRSLANAFVFDVHDRIESLPGATAARKAIVQTGLTYLESLREDAGNDPALARELAAAYERIGIVQGAPLRSNLGDTDGAIASLTRARELLEPLARRGDREARHRLVTVWTELSTVRQARGDAAGTTAALAQARDIGERLLVEMPDDEQLLADMSDTYAMAARVAAGARSIASAEHASRRSLDLASRLLARSPANRTYRDALASAHNALGQTLHAGDGIEQAIEQFRAAIDIREPIASEEPDNAEARRRLLISYGNLGDALGYQIGRNIGDAPGAAAAFEKAVAIAEWERAKDPADRRALFDLASAKLRLGSIEADEPTTAAAGVKDLEEALAICSRLLGEDPASERYSAVAASVGLKLGITLGRLGKNAAAIERLEAARTLAARIGGAPNGHNQLVLASVHLAELKARGGDPAAGALAEFASSELKNRPLGSPFIDATARGDLARACAELARHGSVAERADWARRASDAFADALEHWRQAKVPPVVEPQRAHQIEELESLLARFRLSL